MASSYSLAAAPRRWRAQPSPPFEISTKDLIALIDRKTFHQGPIFHTVFPGKISGKIPRKIFPQSGKFFSKNRFSKNFPRKVIFRGKICTKNRPQVITKHNITSE
jgi:hypothetical protein